MRIDRWHSRRPEGARGTSPARLAGYRRHPSEGKETPPAANFVTETHRLDDEAMQTALSGEVIGLCPSTP